MIRAFAVLVMISMVAVMLVAFDLVAGWASNYAVSEQDFQRTPAPYIYFKGAPSALDHDKFGYRWVPSSVPGNALRISFFGGSTGYVGNPPIASLIEQRLTTRLSRPVAVANFSVVSSNHRMHLHNIIESRSIFEPDIVIFYGGFNETVAPAYYDPRPGYPFNFFFRSETPLLVQWLSQYSGTFGALQMRSGLTMLTPLAGLRNELRPFSSEWSQAIVDNYFETLSMAKTVAEAFPSARCGHVRFVAFYQPYQVDSHSASLHQALRKRLGSVPIAADVSGVFDELGPDIWTDVVHVKQNANEHMAEVIADALQTGGTLAHCR